MVFFSAKSEQLKKALLVFQYKANILALIIPLHHMKNDQTDVGHLQRPKYRLT